MKLAFCLFRYFPFGGLQRDFLSIAQKCLDRGHTIHVFTMKWQGPPHPELTVSLLPGKGYTNHQQCLSFSQQVNKSVKKGGYDLIVGFNKMPGLNVYFAADPCFAAKAQEKNLFYRLSPRYRAYAVMEEAVFGNASGTLILLISPREKEHFIRHYNTAEKRFHQLPPGISRDRVAGPDAAEISSKLRSELGIADNEFMLLMVGSSFATKGLDRSIRAVASLPEPLRDKTKLFVIGEGKRKPFVQLAKKEGVAGKLHFTGGRSDVPRFLLGADLLLHPAYSENTGTVLIEAMASGLPVLASDICGYAFHVRDANAGRLLPSPFQQSTFNLMLREMLISQDRKAYGQNGLEYTSRTDVYSMHEKAVSIIESIRSAGRS